MSGPLGCGRRRQLSLVELTAEGLEISENFIPSAHTFNFDE